MLIRPAAGADVDAIYNLIEIYAPKAIVLKRSRENIAEYLGNFIVAEIDGKVVGCAALRDFGNNLLEVRSLVIDPNYQGRGIGRKLVNYLVERTRQSMDSWRIFTLTYEQKFFASLGFKVVDKDMFPEKIWSDCALCPKFNNCDEIAMLLEKS